MARISTGKPGTINPMNEYGEIYISVAEKSGKSAHNSYVYTINKEKYYPMQQSATSL